MQIYKVTHIFFYLLMDPYWDPCNVSGNKHYIGF